MIVALDMVFLILFILAGLLLLLGVIVLLGRWRGGKYLRPILMQLQKIPFVDRWMKKASRAAPKQDPRLASAVTKIERSGAAPNVHLAAQRAMSKLTAAERAAPISRPLESRARGLRTEPNGAGSSAGRRSR